MVTKRFVVQENDGPIGVVDPEDDWMVRDGWDVVYISDRVLPFTTDVNVREIVATFWESKAEAEAVCQLYNDGVLRVDVSDACFAHRRTFEGLP